MHLHNAQYLLVAPPLSVVYLVYQSTFRCLCSAYLRRESGIVKGLNWRNALAPSSSESHLSRVLSVAHETMGHEHYLCDRTTGHKCRRCVHTTTTYHQHTHTFIRTSHQHASALMNAFIPRAHSISLRLLQSRRRRRRFFRVSNIIYNSTLSDEVRCVRKRNLW